MSKKMKDADLDLATRIDRAIDRITSGQGMMRVPVEATDPDVVLSDCAAALAAANEHADQASERAIRAGLALHRANEHADRLAEALRFIASIAVPDELPDGAWVAITQHCNTQVTAHVVRLAGRLLAEHEARKGESGAASSSGSDSTARQPVLARDRAAEESTHRTPDPLRAVAEIAARKCRDYLAFTLAENHPHLRDAYRHASLQIDAQAEQFADAALKEYADGK